MKLKIIVETIRIGSLCVAFQCEADETIVLCGIMSDAVRDLMDFHALNATDHDRLRALLQAIEHLVNLKYSAGRFEETGELMIRASDLVRYGFGKPTPL
jgi:hypothetical protein